MLRHAQFLLLLLLGFAALPAAAAPDSPWLVEEPAVLVDEHGTETIDSITAPGRAADFRPSPRGLAAGYTRKVHWLRLRLAPPPDGLLLLEIQPPYLDDLRFYRPNGAGNYRLIQTGDSYPYASRDLPNRAFLFRVPFADDQPQTVYLRVQTSSSSLAFPRVFVPDDFAAVLGTEYLLLGLYYGALLVMFLFNLWHGHWRHDPDHRAFMLYLVATFLFMFSVNGLAAQYLAPRHPAVGDHMVSVMLMIIIAVAAHFHRRILGVDRRTPLLNAYFLAIIGFALLCLLAWAAGYFTEAARVLTLVTLSFPLIGIARTLLLWRRGKAGSAFLTLAYVTTLLSYIVALLSTQGVLPNSHWQLYGLQIGGLGALAAFNFGLFERLRHIQRQRDDAEERGREIRMELEAENRIRQRQGALIDMLSHEIKTPLSVIRLQLGTPAPSPRMRTHAKRAVLAINDIVERCDYANRLDSGAITVRTAACDAADILAHALAHRGAEERADIHRPPGVDTILQSDAGVLGMLLGNLVDNACKYSPPGERIRIELAEDEARGRAGLRLRIANLCAREDQPDPARVFERYYRAPGAQGKSGSGLGLTIARSLTEMLGGELRYRPSEHEAIFELWLPRNTS